MRHWNAPRGNCRKITARVQYRSRERHPLQPPDLFRLNFRLKSLVLLLTAIESLLRDAYLPELRHCQCPVRPSSGRQGSAPQKNASRSRQSPPVLRGLILPETDLSFYLRNRCASYRLLFFCSVFVTKRPTMRFCLLPRVKIGGEVGQSASVLLQTSLGGGLSAPTAAGNRSIWDWVAAGQWKGC